MSLSGRGSGLFFALILTAVVMLSTASAAASRTRGGQAALDFANGTYTAQVTPSDRPIEQQSSWSDCCTPISPWVVNPRAGQCVWDINEHYNVRTNGYLDAGGSTTWTKCLITEPSSVYRCQSGMCAYWSVQTHGVGTDVWSSSAGLLVQDCFSVPARCFTAIPLWDAAAKKYRYANCAAVQWNVSDPMVQTIAGSNGGVGVFTQVTQTVSNPTGRRVRDIEANAGISSDIWHEGGCLANLATHHTDYPFIWVTP